MASQAQFELIEAYLNQELSSTDRQSFEQELAADESLRADVAAYRALRLGLRGLTIERRVRQAYERYKVRPSGEQPVAANPLTSGATTRQPVVVTRSARPWLRWAAAASVALCAGLYVYQQTTPSADLAYADQSVHRSLRGSADQLAKSLPASLAPTDRAHLLKAIEHYKAGQYDAVIEQLTIPATDRQTTHYQRYFLGLTYLANRQPAKAIAPLQDALGTSSVPLRQKADWFLALAYLTNDQPEQARPILSRIRNDQAHPYHELAQEVYEMKLK